LAALLRFLTPSSDNKSIAATTTGIYKGWLDNNNIKKIDKNNNGTVDNDGDDDDDDTDDDTDADTVVYADGLSYNLKKGWYKFRCACTVDDADAKGMPLSSKLAIQHANKSASSQPIEYQHHIDLYLKEKDGGNLSSISHTSQYKVLVKAVATVLGRMIAGDGMINILKEMDLDANCETLIDGKL
jgi:hypothetical protein